MALYNQGYYRGMSWPSGLGHKTQAWCCQQQSVGLNLVITSITCVPLSKELNHNCFAKSWDEIKH